MMSRLYSVVSTVLLFTITAHLTAADPWSYLSVDIPVALSDMSVTILTTTNNSTKTEGDDEVKKKIILTGGCVSPKGNEWLGKVYGCLELTNKVRVELIVYIHVILYAYASFIPSTTDC